MPGARWGLCRDGAGQNGLQTWLGCQTAAPGSGRPVRPLALRTLGQSDLAKAQRMLVLFRGSRAPIQQAFPNSQLGSTCPKHTQQEHALSLEEVLG